MQDIREADGTWQMNVGQQIANVGSEVARAIRRKKKGDKELPRGETAEF